jgi:hypothetical protein
LWTIFLQLGACSLQLFHNFATKTENTYMDLSKIISISGKPGLFQIINQSRGGVVAQSLLDQKKISIGQTQQVSTLSDISIYTEEGDEPFENVLKAMHKEAAGEKIEIDLKDDAALRNYLFTVLPGHDEDRVYASDIKKMVKWYNLLFENDLLEFDEAEGSEDEKENEGTEASENDETNNEAEIKKGD